MNAKPNDIVLVITPDGGAVSKQQEIIGRPFTPITPNMIINHALSQIGPFSKIQIKRPDGNFKLRREYDVTGDRMIEWME